MKRLRAGVLAWLAAASAALLSVVHGSTPAAVLIAVTTGAAGVAGYLAIEPTKNASKLGLIRLTCQKRVESCRRKTHLPRVHRQARPGTQAQARVITGASRSFGAGRHADPHSGRRRGNDREHLPEMLSPLDPAGRRHPGH